MISFPNAKINLGLQVLGKRNDGFHDIQSCLYPIPITDALEIIPAATTGFSCSGIPIPGNDTENLILKAYQLIAAEFPEIAPITAHLHKCIPIGAGLGGGSSDAAFALKMLNEMFELNLCEEKLIEYAGKLGSDCPFFIYNEPQLASGRGEILEKIPLDLASNWLVLVHPGIHVSTQEAYAGITPGPAAKSSPKSFPLPVPGNQNWSMISNKAFSLTIPKLQPSRINCIRQAPGMRPCQAPVQRYLVFLKTNPIIWISQKIILVFRANCLDLLNPP